MVTLTFSQIPDKSSSEENVALRFIVKDEMHISELHALCKRFALALGYADKSVEEGTLVDVVVQKNKE